MSIEDVNGNGARRPHLHAEFRLRAILSSGRQLEATCATLGDALLLARNFDTAKADVRIEHRMVGDWTEVKPVVRTEPGTTDAEAAH